jgi:hypothetical protein
MTPVPKGVHDNSLGAGHVRVERNAGHRERAAKEPCVMPERRAASVPDENECEGAVEQDELAQLRPTAARGGRPGLGVIEPELICGQRQVSHDVLDWTWSRCRRLMRKHAFCTPRARTPRLPSSFEQHTLSQGTRH